MDFKDGIFDSIIDDGECAFAWICRRCAERLNLAKDLTTPGGEYECHVPGCDNKTGSLVYIYDNRPKVEGLQRIRWKLRLGLLHYLKGIKMLSEAYESYPGLNDIQVDGFDEILPMSLEDFFGEASDVVRRYLERIGMPPRTPLQGTSWVDYEEF